MSTASGRDVASIANAWIREPGHPVVHVTARRRGEDLHLSLRQERFFADPAAAATAEPQVWPVPLVIAFDQASGPTEQRLLLDTAQAEVTLPHARWYFPNGGASGFYRFTMDGESLRALAPELQSGLAAHERLSLLDNQWALLRAGHVSLADFFALLDG